MTRENTESDQALATVDFFYGLGSRYSYLASTQIARIARDTGATFRWQPISTHALLARRSDDPFTPGARGQYDWDYRRRDAEAWARYYGVPFNDPIGRLAYEPMLPALAALAADRQGRAESMSHRLFRLIFVDDRTEFGPREVIAEAASLGLDVARFRADLESAELVQEHERRVLEVESRGVFGVPTFFYRDQLYWGNDRLVLLEDALTAE
ncbi:MAG: DsbA family protein [Gammaproteobacteria bacterium]|nr:DsbA family protein [Gammaproteobacteria bacterium]